jgi:hypothetical protein
MAGDQTDIWGRIKSLLPASWFQGDTPIVDALAQGPAWAESTIYSQITYAALQIRIKTATDMWLDIISNDFFGTALPRLANETDGAFRARILANLFVNGPTRTNMSNVLTLITGRTPTIFEPSNTTDSGAFDEGLYWDVAGGMGDPLPYQAFVTVYRPIGGNIDLAELDTYRFSWDSYGAWSDGLPTSLTDAAIIAAVESTKPLGTLIWMRIADNPVTP